MDLIASLSSLLSDLAARILTVQAGIQIATVLASGGLAFATHRWWQSLITRLVGGFEHNEFIRFFLRVSDRIAFPMSMLLYLLICRFVLAQFDFNTTVLDIFTPLLISLAVIRVSVYTLRKGFGPSPALHAWEGVISLFVWGIVALHLIGWLPDVLETLDSLAITLGDGKFSLLSFIKLVIAVAVFIIAANWLTGAIERQAQRSPYMTPSMRVGLTKVSKFVLYALAFLIALNTVGIDFAALAIFSGAIGVGIGFGLQKVFSNFISGFILLFDRSIRPGDVISIGDRFGWVQALHARYVVVRDRDGVETLIPNENLITSEVINWSYTDRTVRVRMPFQVSYNDDPEQVMQILEEVAKEQDRVLKDPEPAARLIGFGDNGIDLELRVWIHDPESGVRNVRSDINVAVWKQFKENDISIPFPQRDVYMYPQNEP